MEGGASELKLINEGAFGCIFYPGINCSGRKESPNYITKIQKGSKMIQNEIAISEKIRAIKGFTKYFAPILKQCPVKITKSKVKDIQKCEVFRKMSESEIKRSTYVSNKIRYVGTQDLKHYIFNELNTAHTISHFYVTYLYLLNGLKNLADHKIIHYDIKPNNIMYDKKLEIPIIIDFGLSIDMHKLSAHTYRNAFYVYDTYTYWCIDIMMCNYIFQVITYERSHKLTVTKEELDTIYDDFMYSVDRKSTPDNDVFNIGIKPIDTTHRKRYDAYFERFLHKSWFSMYEHLIHFHPTWDNYSLAISYLVMLDDIHMEKPDIFSEKDHQFAELLSKIVYAMPNERPSISDTIKQVKKLFMRSRL